VKRKARIGDVTPDQFARFMGKRRLTPTGSKKKVLVEGIKTLPMPRLQLYAGEERGEINPLEGSVQGVNQRPKVQTTHGLETQKKGGKFLGADAEHHQTSAY